MPSELAHLDLEVEFKHLKVGDYIVRDTVIERKTLSDFITSMINKRLVRQLEDLQECKSKLLIIEGFGENHLYNEHNEKSNENGNGVHANALRGFLLTILLRYKIPIIFTKNAEDSAKYISVLSKKQEKESSLNAKKKSLNKKEQIQYIIEGFPGIGPKSAKKLIGKFGSIKNIINASDEELKEVLGKKAEIFRDLVDSEY